MRTINRINFALLLPIVLLAGALSNSATGFEEKKTFQEDLAKLTQILKDGELEMRKSAVRTLGDCKDPRAIEPLCLALRDDSNAVRELAVMNLSNRKLDHRAVSPLIELLQFTKVRSMPQGYTGTTRSQRIVNYAADALARIDDPGAFNLLLNELDSWNELLRQSAVRALIRIVDSHGKPIVVKLLSNLGKKNSQTNEAIMIILGEHMTPPVVEHFKHMMKSTWERTRITAAKYLALKGYRPAKEELVSFLKHKDYMEKALFILAACKDERAVKPLIELVETTGKRLAKSRKITRLTQKTSVPDGAVPPPLPDIRDNPVKYSRVRAINALIDFDVPGARGYLLKLFYEEYTTSRVKIITYMGDSREWRAVGFLLERLADDMEYRVRREALKALQRISGRTYGTKLKKWRKWWRKQRKKFPAKSKELISCEKYYSQKEDEKYLISVHKLIAQLKYSFEYEQLRAIEKLMLLEDPRGVEAITNAMKDKNPRVRLKAVKALRKMKKQ